MPIKQTNFLQCPPMFWQICRGLSFVFSLLFLSLTVRAQSFCVQNFNAYGPAYGLERSARTQALAQELNQQKCDLVQLQEVWSVEHNQELALGVYKQFLILNPNLRDRVGLMSLLPVQAEILAEELHLFKLNDDGGWLDRGRGALNINKAFHAAWVQLPQWPEPWLLINLHLHPSSEEVRIAQIEQVAEFRRQHSQVNVILTGDFNAVPQSREIALTKESMWAQDLGALFFGGSYPQDFCTYCRSNPRSWSRENKIIDYIFVSLREGSEAQLQVEHFEANLKGQGRFTLSDHYGIKAHFMLE